MPRTASVTKCNDPEDALWECLNSGFTGTTPDDTKDLIGVLHPQGIEIHTRARNAPATTPDATTEFEFKEEPLYEGNIRQWIERYSIRDACSVNSHNPTLRLLLADQIIFEDQLRPPTEAGGVRFSRADLYLHFGCSPIALERAGLNSLWTRDFPHDRRFGKDIACVGLGTIDFDLVWMRKAGVNAVWAFIVFKTKTSGTRDRFVREIQRLCSFCELPSFLPFAAITASSYATESRMNLNRAAIRGSDLKLSRFPDERIANEVYFASLSAAMMLAAEQRHTKNMQRVLDKCLDVPDETNIRGNGVLHKHASGLKQALLYQKQVLQGVVEDTVEDQRHTERQIQCVLSIMAQKQQELSIQIAKAQSKLAEASREEQVLSIEIAKASKIIAEETKKDGSSMTTLAVVTLVYLPCTTVSSILAMPLFDWDAEKGVVNPRIWVFFILALPLTVITVSVWQLWLRFRSVRGGGKA